MDKLKSFIEKNKEDFDDIPLPQGHLERFQKKLTTQNSSSRFRQYMLYGLAAAVCAMLLIMISLPGQWIQNQIEQAYETCESREEFEELKNYFEMQIYEVVSQMKELQEENETLDTEGFLHASLQVISSTRRFEREILPELPCSDEGLFVMNQHYGNSLQSLYRVKEQMEIFIRTYNTHD